LPGNQRRGWATRQVIICIFAERHGYGSKELAGIGVFEFKP